MPAEHVLYQHTQSAPGMFIIAAACVLLAVLPPVILRQVGVARPVRVLAIWILSAVCLTVVTSAVIFSRLTVRVTAEAVTWHFAGGALRRSVRFQNIIRSDTVSNGPGYGWGYHTFPGGRVYNVAGSRAVALWTRDHGQVRIGTDEPARLLEAIRSGSR